MSKICTYYFEKTNQKLKPVVWVNEILQILRGRYANKSVQEQGKGRGGIPCVPPHANRVQLVEWRELGNGWGQVKD